MKNQQTNLGKLLQHYRYMQQMSYKALADTIGISVSILSRVMEGGVPDGRTFAKLLHWMMNEEARKQ